MEGDFGRPAAHFVKVSGKGKRREEEQKPIFELSPPAKFLPLRQ